MTAAVVVAGVQAGARATEPHRYEVALNAALTEVSVKVCFAAPHVAALVADAALPAGAIGGVQALFSDGKVATLTARASRIDLGPVPPPCVRYRIDLRALADTGRHSDFQRLGAAVLIDPALMLWRPEPSASETALELAFALPAGLGASVPGVALPRAGGGLSVRIPNRAWSRSARFAFGKLLKRELAIGGAALHVAVLETVPDIAARPYTDWLAQGAAAVTTAYGRFPVPSLQVLIVPVPADREAVPWGEVLRGGGDAILLYVDRTRSHAELAADWVLVHELSHLFHPYLQDGDNWLSEGIATYYQNVLRARAGLLPPREAWRKLHQGYRRGRRQAAPGTTLAAASRDMLRERLFMRVYWSGAAIALLADVELRTGGGSSLDRALEGLASCCLPATRSWRAEEVLARLDAVTGTSVFSRLAGRYLESAEFPDLGPAYAALGLSAKGDELEFSDALPARALRDAIMAPDAIDHGAGVRIRRICSTATCRDISNRNATNAYSGAEFGAEFSRRGSGRARACGR